MKKIPKCIFYIFLSLMITHSNVSFSVGNNDQNRQDIIDQTKASLAQVGFDLSPALFGSGYLMFSTLNSPGGPRVSAMDLDALQTKAEKIIEIQRLLAETDYEWVSGGFKEYCIQKRDSKFRVYMDDLDEILSQAKELQQISNLLKGTDYSFEQSMSLNFPYAIKSPTQHLFFNVENIQSANEKAKILREIFDALRGTGFELKASSSMYSMYKIVRKSDSMSFSVQNLDEAWEKARAIGSIHEALKDSDFEFIQSLHFYSPFTIRSAEYSKSYSSFEELQNDAELFGQMGRLLKNSGFLLLHDRVMPYGCLLKSKRTPLSISANDYQHALELSKRLNAIHQVLKDTDFSFEDYTGYANYRYTLKSKARELKFDGKDLDDIWHKVVELFPEVESLEAAEIKE